MQSKTFPTSLAVGQRLEAAPHVILPVLVVRKDAECMAGRTALVLQKETRMP